MPFGVQDGFGQLGAFDSRSLVRQTYHQRPIAGGFVARASERINLVTWPGRQSPALIALSSQPAPDPAPRVPDDLATPLAADGIRFVVVDRALIALPPRSDLERLGLRFVLQDGARELYRTN